MRSSKDLSFIVKVQFSDRANNLLGFLFILVSMKEMAVTKCEVVVNYFSDYFLRQFSLTTPWVRFLERIGEEYADISESLLRDYSDRVKSIYRLYSIDRLSRMAEIIRDISDPNLKKIMMVDLIKEDLHQVLPGEELVVEFSSEIVGVDKADDSGGDTGASSTEGADVSRGTDDDDIEPHITTVSVEPLIDPIEGTSVADLKIGDVVSVVVDRRRSWNSEGRVISLFSPGSGSDRIVVKLELSEEMWGQMLLSRSMLVQTGGQDGRPPLFRISRDVFIYLTIALLSILVIVLFILLLAGF